MTSAFAAEPPPLPRLFSIRAISVGTFVGGPVAGGIFLGLNYRRLGRKEAANISFALGALIMALMIWMLMVLPSEISDRIPGRLLPIATVGLTAYLAKRLQGP